MTVARFYYFGVLAVPAPAYGDPGPSPAGRTVARRGVGATAQALRQAQPPGPLAWWGPSPPLLRLPARLAPVLRVRDPPSLSLKLDLAIGTNPGGTGRESEGRDGLGWEAESQ